MAALERRGTVATTQLPGSGGDTTGMCARPVRLTRPGRFYHLTSRLIDRRWLIRDDEERATFLRMLGHALEHTDWRCLAYAVMSNHLHFGMIAGEQDLESWAKSVNGNFAQWLNARRRGLGPVFAGRPADFEVLPAQVGDVIAYIHNNPVRAGVVARARDSDWTSHRAYVGDVVPQAWLCVGDGLKLAGFDDRREFDDWVDQRHVEMPRHDARELMRAIRRRGRLNIGTPTAHEVPIVSRPFARVLPDPVEVVAAVSKVVGIPAELFCSRRRLPSFIAARRLVIHVGKRLGLCGSDLAAVLGISEQAVSKIARTDLEGHARQDAQSAYELVCKRDAEHEGTRTCGPQVE